MASSFFKILLDPSADHLPLPPNYACMHLKNKITNAPIIRTSNGGYSWRLKIKQIGDNYCLLNGWNNVVKDIQLCFGDFLFFQLLDKFTFKMSIYNPNGCEKMLPIKKNMEKSDDDPFFMTIVNKTHSKCLRFPGGFAEWVGIDGEGSMTVTNLDGKEWVTGLKLDKSYRRSIRYLLSPGWHRFARENKLSVGDECLFRFMRSEGKLLLAKVAKKKWLHPSREIPVTDVLKKTKKRVTCERGGDVDLDLDLDEECVEVITKSSKMPAKRQRGVPPQQNSRVLLC